MAKARRAVTRVILSLDSKRRVVSVGWEPEGFVQMRGVFCRQVFHLRQSATAVLYRLHPFQTPPLSGSPDYVDGYAACMADLRASIEAKTLREACGDMVQYEHAAHAADRGGLALPFIGEFFPDAQDTVRIQRAKFLHGKSF